MHALPGRLSFNWAASGRLAVLHRLYEFARANHAFEADCRTRPLRRYFQALVGAATAQNREA